MRSAAGVCLDPGVGECLVGDAHAGDEVKARSRQKGIITALSDVGQWRSQLVRNLPSSLCSGKVPTTKKEQSLAQVKPVPLSDQCTLTQKMCFSQAALTAHFLAS